MKNKQKGLYRRKEFQQLKNKIFIRTIIMLVLSVIFVILLYTLILKGHFANWTVRLITFFLGIDYDDSLEMYKYWFRDNALFFFGLAMFLVFLVIFRIYLNWFSRYFMEINQGIDELADEGSDGVVLSGELAATEKKINDIKNTLNQRKMEAQLAEQGKNDLIVYLAHDLKTPLASVIGYLNLLYDEKEISRELQEKYLSITLEKAERLEDLINEFFEIARFNLSNIKLQYGMINLTLLLEQVVFEFQPMLREKNLTLTLNAAENIMLKCDGDKIQRVFDNLIRNAVFYSYENTNIEIDAYCMEQRVTIRFINHGNTIPKENLEKVFEQFYRLDPARGRVSVGTSGKNSSGTGLGLAIAKEIVELHRGTIKAESENDIIEFEVSLPVENAL